jgi:hypothetical protein
MDLLFVLVLARSFSIITAGSALAVDLMTKGFCRWTMLTMTATKIAQNSGARQLLFCVG